MNLFLSLDSYTKGHCMRVARYAVTLARETRKFDELTLNKFYVAGLLHDIGKLEIPSEILNKASNLTVDEYEIIKKHPILGIQWVENIPLIRGFESVIYSHHERWDGNGYPYGLKNNEIPLYARIISLADAFDAMTSKRPYNSALSPEDAYKEIIKGSRNQFDPDLVRVFKKVYPLWVEIFKNCC
ncbi:HD-GYP domain-containing protein [Bacillus cereus]|uniref:HD-GYP domain-containing protein n=2 Tax=Bacillus TaxID=1386 RepID=UPI003D1B8EB5